MQAISLDGPSSIRVRTRHEGADAIEIADKMTGTGRDYRTQNVRRLLIGVLIHVARIERDEASWEQVGAMFARPIEELAMTLMESGEQGQWNHNLSYEAGHTLICCPDAEQLELVAACQDAVRNQQGKVAALRLGERGIEHEQTMTPEMMRQMTKRKQ